MLHHLVLLLGSVLSRRAVVGTATLAAAANTIPPVVAKSPGELVASASLAFQKGDYKESERLWKEVTQADPTNSLGWANLATCCVINSSEDPDAKLGVAPQGVAKERLELALDAVARAEALQQTPDALNLNTRGNALALLLRWEEARAAYSAAATASRRDFESIPRSNEALVLFELGDLQEAERVTKVLVRRDPQFRDGYALLAALRFELGSAGDAAVAINDLCAGLDGEVWCERYSTEEVILGRWTPKAVAAYKRMLREPSIQLELRNGARPR